MGRHREVTTVSSCVSVSLSVHSMCSGVSCLVDICSSKQRIVFFFILIFQGEGQHIPFDIGHLVEHLIESQRNLVKAQALKGNGLQQKLPSFCCSVSSKKKKLLVTTNGLTVVVTL